MVGKDPAVAAHLTRWYIVLVCHQKDVCEDSIGSVYVGRHCWVGGQMIVRVEFSTMSDC